jgi:protein-S-isoprenylcysteine O-methyltransferase Ste14
MISEASAGANMAVTNLVIAAWIETLLCWILWLGAFVKPSRQAKGQKKVASAASSRWGIALVFVAFLLIWIWLKPVGFHKSVASLVSSMIVGPISVFLAWASAHELGKQWRLEAALSEDHELIQTGPYRWIRHPIYTSMFGMLMATGAAYTWWPMWIAGAMAFIAGTEIRVRSEERLLEQQFQDRFREYRSRVPAYIPFVR